MRSGKLRRIMSVGCGSIKQKGVSVERLARSTLNALKRLKTVIHELQLRLDVAIDQIRSHIVTIRGRLNMIEETLTQYCEYGKLNRQLIRQLEDRVDDLEQQMATGSPPSGNN